MAELCAPWMLIGPCSALLSTGQARSRGLTLFLFCFPFCLPGGRAGVLTVTWRPFNSRIIRSRLETWSCFFLHSSSFPCAKRHRLVQPPNGYLICAMAYKHREEIVGKRFLCVSGRGKLSKVSEWDWRAGIIRAASHKDPKHPELSVSSALSPLRLTDRNSRCGRRGAHRMPAWGADPTGCR